MHAATAPHYYYSYNPHGDVVALVDGGSTVATYSYDEYGTPTIWERITTGWHGWHNPFLYDGHDGARYDSETGLYWLSVRAYDPTLGRFLSRDPLGRAPLFFDASQPYAYGGNNPLNNVDPSGQMFRRQMMDGGDWMPHSVARAVTRRVQTTRARRDVGQHRQRSGTSNSKPGRPKEYAQVMALCNQLPGGIGNIIRSKLSSLSASQWGDVLRNVGTGLVVVGILVGVVDIIYTFMNKASKSEGFKLALELYTSATSVIGALSMSPLFKSSAVYKILAGLFTALSVFTVFYTWYKALSPWAQLGADVAITGMVTAAEGEVAPAEAVASSVVGNFVSYALLAWSSCFISIGYMFASVGYGLQGA